MKKEKMCSKKFAKGFTLIELLVVVLIIGILAAVVIPQYKLAVAKTKFSELKMFTKNLAGAVQRHYLIHGTYSFDVKDLDIDININSSNNTSWFTTKDGMDCYTWEEGNQDLTSCTKIISGTKIQYLVNRDSGIPRACSPYSTNQKDLANRLCQQETKRTYPNHGCTDNTCTYTY